MSNEFLDDLWILYFHAPDDERWTLDSYEQLCAIGTPDEALDAAALLRDAPGAAGAMWFCMRESVAPTWDDSANIDGGCVSVCVPNDAWPGFWAAFLPALASERLCADESAARLVNGVSSSPKRGFAVLKIWVAADGPSSAQDFDGFPWDALPRGAREMRFRSNRDAIAFNNARLASASARKTP